MLAKPAQKSVEPRNRLSITNREVFPQTSVQRLVSMDFVVVLMVRFDILHVVMVLVHERARP
jgi:hypothetical protein